MNECGLDEYCIKVCETDKLPYLIDKAKNEADIIRLRQFDFRNKAESKLTEHIAFAKEAIDKA